MNLSTSGLAGINKKFNNILSQIDSTTKTMKEQIESDASLAVDAIGAELSSLSGELRSMVPQGLALPNINLQSQLSSLSGITDVTQASNLLASITSNFGSALSASGFNLDSLVSSAASAVAAGKSLSFDIPNFEKAADGVSDAAQKAVAAKMPSTDVVKETVAKFTANDTLTSLKSSAADAVISVSTTLPTEDTAQLTITEKTTKITQGTITKEVTTAKDAIEGEGAELKRKNLSEAGFVTRPVLITENILSDDVGAGHVGPVIELKKIPTKVRLVYGWDDNPDAKGRRGRRRYIVEEPLNKAQLGRFDTFTVSGNEILINESLRIYEEAPSKKSKGIEGLMFVVRYETNSTYDPTYDV